MGRGNRTGHKRRPGRCSTCKGPVAGHIGRPGKSCKNLPLDELVNMAAQQDPVPHHPEKDKNDEIRDNDGENEDEINNFNELKSVTLGMKACIELLSDSLKELHVEMKAIRDEGRSSSRPRRSRSRSRSRGRRSRFQSSDRSRHETRFNSRDNSNDSRRDSSRRYGFRNDDETRDRDAASYRNRDANHRNANGSSRHEASNHSYDEWGPPPPLELPTPVQNVVAPQGGTTGHRGQPHGGARPRRREMEPRLRPVDPEGDLTGLPMVPGLTDSTIKKALTGQYISLETFLGNLSVNEEDNNDNNQRAGQGKRTIFNFLSWLEAWEAYTRVMVSYHGMEMFLPMSQYKTQILNWEKRYLWKAVYSFDIYHRGDLANRNSVNFMDIDALEAINALDTAMLKLNVTRCDVCRSFDHISRACPFAPNMPPQPFRWAPGPYGAGGRQQSLVPRFNVQQHVPEICLNWNAQRCGNSQCGRIHCCKGCNGDMPYDICTRVGKCGGKGTSNVNFPPNTNMPPPGYQRGGHQ